MASLRRSPPDSSRSYGCFLKWWYPQSTSKWSFYSEKPWLLGTTILGNPHICCNASVSPCLSDMWRWSLIISPQEIGNNALPPKSWFSGKMGVSSKIRFLHLKGNFSNWTMMGERYPWWSQTWHAGCQRWLPHPKELVGTTLRDAIVTTRIMRINMPFLVGDPDPNLGGGFKYVLFSPLPGDMIQFDEHIFQMGWNHLHLPLLLGAAGRSLLDYLDWWGGRIHCSTPFGRFWLQCQCSSVVLGLIESIYL